VSPSGIRTNGRRLENDMHCAQAILHLEPSVAPTLKTRLRMQEVSRNQPSREVKLADAYYNSCLAGRSSVAFLRLGFRLVMQPPHDTGNPTKGRETLYMTATCIPPHAMIVIQFFTALFTGPRAKTRCNCCMFGCDRFRECVIESSVLEGLENKKANPTSEPR
jgi:hypothetical protein